MEENHLHRFSRTELLIGSEGLATLSQKCVAVIGLGGVGSYIAEALARGGIGSMVLIDFDEICLSNTNRQLHATLDNYGHNKVDAMAERIISINPAMEVIRIKEFITPDNLSSMLSPKICYVADAIDTVPSKIALIAYCFQNNIPIISSMGTGNKINPLAFRVDDISRTHTCPLARSVRVALRDLNIEKGIKVVFSIEKPLKPRTNSFTCPHGCTCSPHTQIENCTKRKQIPGSMSYIPPIAGLIMAGEIIKDLLKSDT